MAHIVVGISGASGIRLAIRTLEVLEKEGHSVEVVFSKEAALTATYELNGSLEKALEQFSVHDNSNLAASIASGSFRTDGMLIIPCSMTTLAALAAGFGDTLLRRAADVTVKEGRPLVIVPRETPLHMHHIENMLRLSKRGVKIVPPVPGWYAEPKTIEDVEDFIVAKALGQLRIEVDLYTRWK